MIEDCFSPYTHHKTVFYDFCQPIVYLKLSDNDILRPGITLYKWDDKYINILDLGTTFEEQKRRYSIYENNFDINPDDIHNGILQENTLVFKSYNSSWRKVHFKKKWTMISSYSQNQVFRCLK